MAWSLASWMKKFVYVIYSMGYHMKKMLIAAVAALGMMSVTASFATDALNGTAGKNVSVMSTLANQARTKAHINDVFVLNASSNQIYVQSLPYVNDLLGLNAFDNLFSNGCIPVTIINSYNNEVLMNRTLCSRSLIVVRGAYNGVYIDEFDTLLRK